MLVVWLELLEVFEEVTFTVVLLVFEALPLARLPTAPTLP